MEMVFDARTRCRQSIVNASFRAVVTGLLLASGSVAANDHPFESTCWQQSFEDQFEQLDLYDATTGEGQWKTSYIWPRDVIINNELQYYIDPSIHGHSPYLTDDGVLHIVADRTTNVSLDTPVQSEYVSGVLTTEKSFAQQYGRFEVSAKVPAGRGLWPAFWLLPSFDQWPEGVAVLPELDVMEFLGHEPRTFHTTLHTNQTGKLTSHPYTHTLREDLTKEFHLYSTIWSEREVRWFIDGKLVARHPTPADFTRPVHFLLNLAVGGNWPGAPDRNTRFPAHFEIDYVKAYKSIC